MEPKKSLPKHKVEKSDNEWEQLKHREGLTGTVMDVECVTGWKSFLVACENPSNLVVEHMDFGMGVLTPTRVSYDPLYIELRERPNDDFRLFINEQLGNARGYMGMAGKKNITITRYLSGDPYIKFHLIGAMVTEYNMSSNWNNETQFGGITDSFLLSFDHYTTQFY